MLGVLIGYYIALGDLLPPILFGDDQAYLYRTKILLIVGIFLVQPLVLLKDLSKITQANSASLCGYGIVLSIIIFKAFVNGAFFNLFPGLDLNLNYLSQMQLSSELDYQVKHNRVHQVRAELSVARDKRSISDLHQANNHPKNQLIYWDNTHFFSTMSLFALAFSCHPQIFIIYNDLKSKTGKIQISRLENIVTKAITYVGALYTSIGLCGYLTFSDDLSGNLLTNYSNESLLTVIMRCSFCFSCIISFPILIFPVRQSIFTLLRQLFFSCAGGVKNGSHNYHQLTEFHNSDSQDLSSNPNPKEEALFIPHNIFLILSFTINIFSMYIAIVTPDIAKMLKFVGATMGSTLCFILPSCIVLFRKEQKGLASQISSNSNLHGSSLKDDGIQRRHVWIAKFLLIVGILVFVITPITILTDENLEIKNDLEAFGSNLVVDSHEV